MILLLMNFACTTTDSEDKNLDQNDTASENTTNSDYWYLPESYGSIEPVRIVVMGDSISEGAGADTENLTYKSLLYQNDSEAWPEFDEQDLTSFYPSLVEVYDVAVGGATTTSLVNDQLPAAADDLGDSVEGETIVVMTISGNDVNAAVTQLWYLLEVNNDPEAADEVVAELIARVGQNIETIIDFYDDTARFPDGAYIYMANVYDPTDGTGDLPACYPGLDLSSSLSYLDEINDALVTLAIEREVAVLDIQQHFLGHGFHFDNPDAPFYDASNPEMWFADCVHPNNTGHNELRQMFYSAITGSPFTD